MTDPHTRYSWQLLRAGAFKLDGGSMFGLVPRVVWSKNVTPDDRGRITVQHNCLLLQRDGSGPGPARVLLETGSGDKLDPKSREIFQIGDDSIIKSLHAAGCDEAAIEAVLVTHLHFDHAGGLTRALRPGETPDWVGPGSAGESKVKLTFPNAKIYVQAREWDDARANRSVMTRTYFHDHIDPLEKHLALVDSPRPWPIGYTPDRDELPPSPVERRETQTAPGVTVFLVPGHTWGQQAMKFTDVKGRTVVFVPDVLPTALHNGAAYSLGYDVEPYTSMISRLWLLTEAARHDWVLVLDHEPAHPCFRVRANTKGWFDLVPEEI